jgi:hypothetical protein
MISSVILPIFLLEPLLLSYVDNKIIAFIRTMASDFCLSWKIFRALYKHLLVSH